MIGFDLEVTLLQPAVREGVKQPMVERTVYGREVATRSGNTSGVVDGAVSVPSTRVVDVIDPPAGVGSQWKCVIEKVEYTIDTAVIPRTRKRMLRLNLTSTKRTGLQAVLPAAGRGFDGSFGPGFG